MKHNLKTYIKSFAFIFFAMSTGFTKSPVDTIVDHHTQRRILVNTNIIENKGSIKHESDTITNILTNTPVDIKRHASAQEKFHILRAVVGDRFVARTTEHLNTEKYEETYSNPYTAILTKLTPNNLALRNHYRVLELSYDLGDCVGTCDLQSEKFLGISKELSTLTGMDFRFYCDLTNSVIWEHHLATRNQVTENMFELILHFAQQKDTWSTEIVMESVAEINSHPLSECAQLLLSSGKPESVFGFA